MNLTSLFVKGIHFKIQSLPLPFKIQSLPSALSTEEIYSHLWIYAEPLNVRWQYDLRQGKPVVFRAIGPASDPLGYSEEELFLCTLQFEKQNADDFAHILKVELKDKRS
jgi:hypothetical protein